MRLFQRGKSTILVKNLKFSLVFNLVKVSQENVFDDILERRKSIFTLWKHEVKEVETWDLSKGVSPWF